MRTALLCLALLLLGALPVRADEPIPKELRELRIAQRLGEQLPLDLTFRDEQGRDVHLSDYVNGKPVLLVLAYIRCPRLCNEVLHNLVETLRGIPFNAGKDYQVVVVSFDAREGPDLASAAKETAVSNYGRPGGERGWHFLTGTEANIRRLANAVGFRYVYDAERNEYRHSAGIMLLTPDGKVARYFFGILFPERDLRLGLVEASQGKIGSVVDNAVLWTCLSYNPETGKYSIAAMKLMRLGGALTIAILAVCFGVNWWRARRRGTPQACVGAGSPDPAPGLTEGLQR